MDLKGINLHIENLVPGVVLAAELTSMLNLPKLPLFAGTGLEGGTTFIAFSYMIGVLSATLSRAILDAISEFAPRAIIFRLLAHHDLVALKDSLGRTDLRFEADLKARKFHELPWAHDWNCVYRSILRSVLSTAGDKAKDEIYRRRENARLVRNFFAPSVLGFVALSSGPAQYQLVISSVIFGIGLYAYAELNIFAEAADIYWGQPSSQVSTPQAKPKK